MRGDVQRIFKKTPVDKQVMMFTATLPEETKIVCKKFMRKPVEIIVKEQNIGYNIKRNTIIKERCNNMETKQDFIISELIKDEKVREFFEKIKVKH